jgi:hypothetical protein
MLSGDSLEEIRDSYKEERIFLVGNGPSINQTPLEELCEEYTLGMQQISYYYSETEWRPTFYYFAIPPERSVNEKKIMKNYIRDSVQASEASFLQKGWREVLDSHSDTFYFDRWQFDRHHNPFHNLTIEECKNKTSEFLHEFWSDDITNLIYHYHTMYGAMQLAVYLGFDEIYLIGCDLGFNHYSPHMIFDSGLDPNTFSGSKRSYILNSIHERNLLRSLINATALKLIRKFDDNQLLIRMFNQDNSDHFTSDYVDRLLIGDDGKSEMEIRKSHVAAKKICSDKGVNIYNATYGGELEIYERVNLREII